MRQHDRQDATTFDPVCLLRSPKNNYYTIIIC